MDCTDWDVFGLLPTVWINVNRDLMSYISFCEDYSLPIMHHVSSNNDEPWFTAKLRKLRLQKEEAFRSVDRDRFRESMYICMVYGERG